jgi:hypothetical protein
VGTIPNPRPIRRIAIALLATMAPLAMGCGGSTGSPAAGGGGLTGCTVAVSGDAASGVGAATVPCGFPKDILTVTAPVAFDVTITVAGSSTRGIGIALLGPRSVDLPNMSIGAGLGAPLSVPVTLTEQDLPSSVGGTSGALYSRSSSAVWLAAPRSTTTAARGSYTLHLDSATATDLADCASSVEITSLYPATACFRVHGSAHAVLVPFSSLPGNTAAGTVTLDWTF